MNPSSIQRDLPLEQFVEKFKGKDTDECYTPPAVYEAVLNWCRKEYNIPDDAPIVRPFRPGGDYQAEMYPQGCYVIDNPPFSILADICQFYNACGFKYFLFGNGLTILNLAIHANLVIACGRITYANGASVNTSFVTNMGDYWVQTRPDLRLAIKEAMGKEPGRSKPTYEYDRHILPSAHLSVLATNNVDLRLTKKDATFVRTVGNEKNHPFGGALLLKDAFSVEAHVKLAHSQDVKRTPVTLTAAEYAYVMQED